MWKGIFCFLFLGKVQYIRSQKKNPQLVYNGFIYNKKLTQANGHTTWRCSDVTKNKCRAVCITNRSQLIAARRTHDHSGHWGRIANRPLYSVEEDLEYLEVDASNVQQLNKVKKVIATSDSTDGVAFYTNYKIIDECNFISNEDDGKDE